MRRLHRGLLATAAAAAVAASVAGVHSIPTSDSSPSPVGVQHQPRNPSHNRVLSNGCSYTERGIPVCGAFLGAAYGGNTSPTSWERAMGHRLGVHRTYFSADQVNAAVDQARRDLRHRRLPWISFKLPYSWSDMARGRGDEWARAIGRDLAGLPGPVWVAFHHEPENDGDIDQWTSTQARLAPIVRAAAPNVAYTIILTGWNQLYGPRRLSLEAVWPRHTKIDVVGFDVYDRFGVWGSGQSDSALDDLGLGYFPYFQQFAAERGLAWGLAETGYTDEASAVDPHWVSRTYRQLVQHHGVAMSYFDSDLNSDASWRLTGLKARDFATALSSSPTL